MMRRVTSTLAFRIARNCLGRMACNFMDPTGDDHNHLECLRDDEAYIADLQLRLLAAAALGDETLALDRLTELMAATDTD